MSVKLAANRTSRAECARYPELMRVAIAGAHGKIGLLLTRLLVRAGDSVIGLVRNPDHFGDVSAAGGEPVRCDLERAGEAEIAEAITGADAAVFAAGAGPGSGAERKLTMDRDGAIKLLHAARQANVARYVIVSSVGAENPPPKSDGDVFSVYLRAKAEADAAVKRQRPRMDDPAAGPPHRRPSDRPGAD